MRGGRVIPPRADSAGAPASVALVAWRPPDVTERALAWARIDFSPSHRPPAWWRVALATVLSIAGRWRPTPLLVAIGTRLFPSTKGYVHFQFDDYARLTVVGVLIACAAWPVVARFSSAPAGSSSGWPSR